MTLNFFTGAEVASRYAASRPSLHHHAIEWIRHQIPLPVPRALDVGCGTGLSTAPLMDAAAFVVGVDPSEAMLRLARERVRSAFVLGDGNRLPFQDDSFQLVTLSSAIHWLSGEGVRETARVLLAGGWLASYDVWFVAKMRDEPKFEDWMHSLPYPAVSKRNHSGEEIAAAGLYHLKRGDSEYWVTMDAERLTSYLMTHSERLAAVREGRETESEQRAFLRDGIARFFGRDQEREVRFGLGIDLYERRSDGVNS
jgi:SAM-dependent methyltransferase